MIEEGTAPKRGRHWRDKVCAGDAGPTFHPRGFVDDVAGAFKKVAAKRGLGRATFNGRRKVWNAKLGDFV